MVLPKEREFTIDEFEELLVLPENSERLLELIDGRLREKTSTTEEHGELEGIIGTALLAFVRPRKSGRVTLEARHKMPRDRRNSRLPDVSFISGQRPRVTKGSIPQMPDLAVEVKSPDESLKSLRAKADYYMAHGTRLVWIVDPAKQIVIVLTPDSEDIKLIDETLDGDNVLPGFTPPVRDIFVDPLSE